MATGDWYYQIWRHCGQRNRVHVVGTYKSRSQAEDVVDSLNEKEKSLVDSDHPPFNVYFVRPILEKHLHVDVIETFRRHLNEDRKSFLAGYDGYLKEVARKMVIDTLFGMESCNGTEYFRLSEKGGNLDCYICHIQDVGKITCSVLFTGRDTMRLKLYLEKERGLFSCIVETFPTEKALKAWLLNIQEAETTVEDKLIGLICDRYHK